MNTNKEPDKSVGGTFHYDKDGNFERHEPTTKPRPPLAQPTDAAAQADESKTAKRGKN